MYIFSVSTWNVLVSRSEQRSVIYSGSEGSQFVPTGSNFLLGNYQDNHCLPTSGWLFGLNTQIHILDAYFPLHQCSLHFWMDSQHYQFVILPFDLSTTPQFWLCFMVKVAMLCVIPWQPPINGSVHPFPANLQQTVQPKLLDHCLHVGLEPNVDCAVNSISLQTVATQHFSSMEQSDLVIQPCHARLFLVWCIANAMLEGYRSPFF